MKRFAKKKKLYDNSSYIALSTVIILLVLPITIAFLMRTQTVQQHAQMTLPPAPPGCHYEVADCSAGICDSDFQRLVCPNTTITPNTPSINVQQEAVSSQSGMFATFNTWIKSWFK